MIFDELKNIAQYKNLDERLKLGFDFLLNNDLENLECKKHNYSDNQGDSKFKCIYIYLYK